MFKIKNAVFIIFAIVYLFGCLLGDDIDALRERAGSSSDPVYISPGIEMVWINSGSFFREGNTITLSGFYMGKYEVTQEQYRMVMGTNPSYFSNDPASGEIQGKRPVEYVLWYDAIEFCNKLSEMEGLTPYYNINKTTKDPNNTNEHDLLKWLVNREISANGYRLPTEAQWEYACRAGTTTYWSFGDDESELVYYACYDENSNNMTHQVGLRLPNAWGLYDMHGNVWEWCWDWRWDEGYPDGAQSDPTGAVSGTDRVIRGGSWYDSAMFTGSPLCASSNPVYRFPVIGFRVVRPHTSSEISSYTVTYHANSATSGTSPVQQTAAYGTSITLPNAGNLERTGCTFAGWNTSADGTGTNYNAGASYTVNGNVTLYAKWIPEIEMVWISSGSFDRDGNTITISSGFYMGKYEVTQEQYEAVMGTNHSFFSSNPAAGETQGKRPVERVTWFDAIEFCNKLSEQEGLTPVYTITNRNPTTGYPITDATVTAIWSNNGYRLPTEAQWEYACRAGTMTDWYFSDEESKLDSYAWYDNNSSNRTHQVGVKLPNAWGLYDMHGNVWEWCWDWYGDYPAGAQSDPMGASSGTDRVLRGGSWSSSAGGTRSASRGCMNPAYELIDVGFRVVRLDTSSEISSYTVTYNANSATSGTTPTPQTVSWL